MSSKNSTTSKIGHRRQVVLPKEVCDGLGMGEGDFVEMTPVKGGVLIRPKKLVDPDDVLSAADIKSLRKGLAEAKRGQTRPWDIIKHELER
jgi:AbrB family looped-hinge helix DNA binding protein